MKPLFFILATSLALQAGANAQLKVATLHPLLNDLARSVGDDSTTIVPLFPEGGDPHSFSPEQSALAALVDCQLVLASGMGLENYLGKLSDNLPASARLIDVSAKLPPLLLEEGHEHHDHDHQSDEHCDHSRQDPHWWHSPKAIARAARNLAKDFSIADPANATKYRDNARTFGKKMDALAAWATAELSAIPSADRELATAHSAFGYFCRDFHFRAFPVQGISRERESSGKHLAEIITKLRKENIRAVFPERLANEKTLKSISEEAGVKIGGTLDADATTPGITYDSLIRKNVKTIAKAFQ